MSEFCNSRLVSLTEVMNYLRVSRTSLYTLMGRQLPYIKVGRKRCIDPDDLGEFLHRNRIGGFRTELVTPHAKTGLVLPKPRLKRSNGEGRANLLKMHPEKNPKGVDNAGEP